jgi:hypothetical protein
MSKWIMSKWVSKWARDQSEQMSTEQVRKWACENVSNWAGEQVRNEQLSNEHVSEREHVSKQ